MNKIVIKGGIKLKGTVKLSGDKITTVHLVIMSVLLTQTITINNANLCGDVRYILNWLKKNKVKNVITNSRNYIKLIHINNHNLDLKELAKSRASICLLSGYTSINKATNFYVPGGCNFTQRSIDQHLYVASKLGIKINIEKDIIKTTYKNTNKNITISCATKFGPSVGVTCHGLFHAINYEKKITLTNIAIEPVIISICNVLKKIGKKINIDKNKRIIHIEHNTTNSKNITIKVPNDSTEAITFIAGAITTRSTITIENPYLTKSILELLKKIKIKITSKRKNKKAFDCTKTEPLNGQIICDVWPQFPSDAGPIISAALLTIKGNTIIQDKIYHKRDSHITELTKLGYKFINITDNCYQQFGNNSTKIKEKQILIAKDIRAGAALLINALTFKHEITIENFEQVERGYYQICQKFRKLGASILQYEE